ncbi:MAG: hypothetical protein WBA31_09715 [Candidatus Dormiibacterota bacterium]
MPFADEFAQIPFVVAAAHGHLTLAQIWAPHNDNRILLPNLLAIALLLPTHYNLTAEMWASVGIVLAAFLVLMRCLERESDIRGWWLLPVALLFFDLTQWENMLWGFQLAWYLILLMLVVVVYNLTGQTRGWMNLVIASAAGLIGTFSSLQGLIIWPDGALLLLICGPRQMTRLVAWCSLGVLSGIVYFENFPPLENHSALFYSLGHPETTVAFFVTVVGGPAGHHAEAFGVVVLAGVVALVAAYWTRSDLRSQLRVPLALVVFALIFDVVVTIGRVNLGSSEGASSRYTTYNLLALIGLYSAGVIALRATLARRQALSAWLPEHARALVAFATCLLLAIGLVGATLPGAIRQSSQVRESRVLAATLLLHYKTAPNANLAAALFPPSAAYVRRRARQLQRNHWSVFYRPAG